MANRLASQSVKYLVPFIITISALDSVLKEQAWVPTQAKQFAFYLLGPIVAVGMMLVIPYIRSRLEIVAPRRTSNLILGIAIGISAVQIATWALMYYQATWMGSNGIGSTALFLKDFILVSSGVIFALLSTRLFRWYVITRNRIVLLFGGFAAGDVVFVSLHFLSDYVGKPVPLILTQISAVTFLFFVWSGIGALSVLIWAYYNKAKRFAFLLVVPHVVLASAFMLAVIFRIALDPNLRSITVFGLAIAGPVYLAGFFLVVPAILNRVAREYYKGVGYGMGLLSSATCGMGLGVSPLFPLSGFPSLTILSPGACLAFAAFTSCASYFSISEDVRKEIRKAEKFATSMGEAETRIAIDQQVATFYDKFTGMAEASGAVEATAISKDEIYSYAAAVRRMQQKGSTP